MEDFVKRFNPKISDRSYVITSRYLSLFWGLVCLLLAFFTGNIEGTVIEVINKVGSVFYGPILGAFVLAILTKKLMLLGLTRVFYLVCFSTFIYGYLSPIFFGFGGMQLDV